MTRMLRRGQQDVEIVYKHLCDTIADRDNIDPQYINLGTLTIVLQGENGIEMYVADSNKEWNKVFKDNNLSLLNIFINKYYPQHLTFR